MPGERVAIRGTNMIGGPDGHGNEDSRMRDHEIREALNRHWTALDAADFATEHDIYQEDAILDYPQSRERIAGRRNIQIARSLQPGNKRFAIHRITGSGDLWVSEYVLTYDNQPFYVVSIMQFHGVKVAHETQYFADPFHVSEWRKPWLENIDYPKDQVGSEGTFAGLGGGL
jgi:hypothetical protein